MAILPSASEKGSLILAVWLLSACAPSPLQPEAPLEGLASHLDRRVPALLARYRIPGASLALVRGGRLAWSGAYGYADRERRLPATTETVFQVASISKTVTAWGVMRLVERGLLDLDAPVERYLSRWQLRDPPALRELVTVRRLRSHSAGLPSIVYSDVLSGSSPPALEDLLSGLGEPAARARLVRPPGSAFLYSNPGFVMLELIVEERSGEPFAVYMTEEILRPLGMSSSSFERDGVPSARIATGYGFDGSPAPDLPLAAKAPGGLYATAPDLARFVAAGTRGAGGEPAGRGVLKPESVARLHTPEIETRGLFALASDAYGLGHFVETLSCGQRVVMHGGENAGWISHFYAVPEAGEGIVILTNSERSHRFVAQVVEEWASWRGLGSLKMGRSMQRVTVAMRSMAALLLLLSSWLGWRLVRGIASGTRRPGSMIRRPLFRRLLQGGLGASLLGLWWGFGHGFLLPFFPVLTRWLDASLSACATLVLVSALFAEVDRDRANGIHGNARQGLKPDSAD